MRSVRGICAGWVAGIGLLIFFGAAQFGLRSLGSDGSAFVNPPPEYLGGSIDPRVVRMFLGTRLLFADLIWIDTLIKSDTAREPEPFTAVYRAFRKVVALDPDNFYAYYVAGMYLSVIKDDIKGATAILREGARAIEGKEHGWAGAWNLPFALGYNLMFEEQELEEGSEWIRMAGGMPGAPLYVRTLANRVATEEGRLEAGARILADLYRRVSKPVEKERVERKMLAIASKQELVELNAKFAKFLSTTGAYALTKQKQFNLFMRSLGHSKKDVMGRPIGINSMGRIGISDQ